MALQKKINLTSGLVTLSKNWQQVPSVVRWVLIACVLLFGMGLSHAEDVYLKPSDFIKKAFRGSLPPTQVLTLDASAQKRAEKIMRRAVRPRIRYWEKGSRSVWILEEIGKTKPITTGFIVDGGKLKEMRVLVYRESHGWEIRKSFFTKQFVGNTLTPKDKLSRPVSNIAGATLSVRAVSKMARLALYFDTIRS